ncbi:flagellar basal-body rod protein FlgB [Desulfitispora alkaliphila]|uniref:flagellar basal body rod protein FlgB n=1 Tax=Desulfitispora alkaliphila TaxID=622674 RepID=UPI003D2497F1
MGIFSRVESLSLLEKGLEASSLRHQVISNNIANVETPGFKRGAVSFEDELKKQLKNKRKLQPAITNPKHISLSQSQSVQPQVIRVGNTFMRNDRNNVDIDREMADLTKNTLTYQSMIEQLTRQIGMLRTAVNEGRR